MTHTLIGDCIPEIRHLFPEDHTALQASMKTGESNIVVVAV
jgi:hypothetical protein